MRRKLCALTALAGSFVGLLVSCGSSFESIYESDVRFEHCHRLDRDTQVASPHREYCWKEWLAVYSYNQTRDRVEYAERRLRVLRGEPPPGSTAQAATPVPVGAAGAAAQIPAGTAGTETDVAVTEPAGAAPPEANLPGANCAQGCKETLLSCKENCQTAARGCVPCEPEYRECMQRCFK